MIKAAICPFFSRDAPFFGASKNLSHERDRNPCFFLLKKLLNKKRIFISFTGYVFGGPKKWSVPRKKGQMVALGMMDVVFVRCWFSLFLVTAVWNRRGMWKKSLLPLEQ